jgi:lysophospholipase L1-like esterase
MAIAPKQLRCLERTARALVLALAWLGVVSAGPSAAQMAAPELPPVPTQCGGDTGVMGLPLPNSSQALQQRKKLKIVAIGASSSAVLGGGWRGGGPPLLEQVLEKTIKGLDVEIINRGFSGELAEAAGERIKIEVALNHPDIVLWQVGTNDALAHVPVESFRLSVSNTVRWLKAHNIDVILVGLHYMKHLVRDPYYQGIRKSLGEIASGEKVLRIGRYEAMEVLARTMAAAGQPEQEVFGLTEDGYNCMAQYIARNITVGIFAKRPKTPN